jgi:hypothetical protein
MTDYPSLLVKNQTELVQTIKTYWKSGKLDLIGSILSLGCAIHCLVFPVLISLNLFVAIGGVVHAMTEAAFLMFTLILAFWSTGTSYPHHRKLSPVLITLISLIFILAAMVFVDHYYEAILNITGALLITNWGENDIFGIDSAVLQ